MTDRSSTAERRELLAEATPGPWHVSDASRSYFAVGSNRSGQIVRTTISRLSKYADEGSANAALIVVAVNDYARHLDMEEALRALVDFIGIKDMRVYASDPPVVRARTLLTGDPHVQ